MSHAHDYDYTDRFLHSEIVSIDSVEFLPRCNLAMPPADETSGRTTVALVEGCPRDGANYMRRFPPVMKSHLLTGPRSFATEFTRCCTEYHSLSFATAWCGDPARTLPFRHLEKLAGRITATIGVSFNNTHPDAISWLLDAKVGLRIYRDELGMFHPKVYLFQAGARYALFVGSSNFTHAGFYTNTELNVLLEGRLHVDGGAEVSVLASLLSEWHSIKCSFVPNKLWLDQYRSAYLATRTRAKREAILTPPDTDEVAPGNWLATAEWDEFYAEVISRLKQESRTAEGYHDVLDAAGNKLPFPWVPGHFRGIEQRRIIGGLGKYGWLGHVAVSGRFRSLLAKGSSAKLRKIAGAINQAGALSTPVKWTKLKRAITRLEGLGFTMKTWGRLLALTRPDLYCTVSADSVRENLSGVLGMPQSHFQRSDGYIRLLQLIHRSPWFRSDRPSDPAEAAIWDRRVAFIDPIYYRGRNPT